MTGEAEAVLAADQANLIRLIAGGGFALVGLAFFLWLLIKSRKRKISSLSWGLALALTLGGLFLAKWQVYH